MKNFFLSVFLFISLPVFPQSYFQKEFENTIHGISTIIDVQKSTSSGIVKSYGSGFFYHKYKGVKSGSPEYNSNSVDSTLESIWLITNKHVIFGKANFTKSRPAFPLNIRFYIRRVVKGSKVPVWDTILLQNREVVAELKFHSDSLTDVVAINVTRYVLPKLLKGDGLFIYSAVSKVNFPTDVFTEQGYEIGLGKDVLAVGYPRNFYDTSNLFPTVKTGIIASQWNRGYNGSPNFLVDCKLFPGSSGSLVISKPVRHGSGNEDKGFDFFRFIGIYSGELQKTYSEPIVFDEMTIYKTDKFDTGIVWYYYLIEEIINGQKDK